MAALKILAQNDLEGEYEDRPRAKRDLQNLETRPDPGSSVSWAEHRLDVVSRERDETRRNAKKQGLARSSER
jgi:hypothetical protein